jgi:hypothetical protein
MNSNITMRAIYHMALAGGGILVSVMTWLCWIIYGMFGLLQRLEIKLMRINRPVVAAYHSESLFASHGGRMCSEARSGKYKRMHYLHHGGRSHRVLENPDTSVIARINSTAGWAGSSLSITHAFLLFMPVRRLPVSTVSVHKLWI